MSAPSPEKPKRRFVVAFVLVALIVVAATGWAREAAQSPELVDVLVAEKDFSQCCFTASDVNEHTSIKRLPKSVLPKNYITNKEDLIGRFSKGTLRCGECFRPDDLSSNIYAFGADQSGALGATFPDVYSFSVPWAGDVAVGNRVDVIGFYSDSKQRVTLRLLTDMEVAGIYPPQTGASPNTMVVSLYVREDTGRLLMLARNRNVKLELLTRIPGRLRDHNAEQHARKQAESFLVKVGDEDESVE